MQSLVHERDALEHKLRAIRIRCRLDPGLSLLHTLNQMGGTSFQKESDTLHHLQSQTPLTLSISLESSDWISFQVQVARVYKAYLDSPCLYHALEFLDQGRPVTEILGCFSSEQAIPSVFAVWEKLVSGCPRLSFLERVRHFGEAHERLCLDPYYPDLRPHFQPHLLTLLESLQTELYLHYGSLSDPELHQVFIHLQVSPGLLSLIEDCAVKERNPDAECTPDLLVVSVLTLLLTGLGLGFAHRWKKGI